MSYGFHSDNDDGSCYFVDANGTTLASGSTPDLSYNDMEKRYNNAVKNVINTYKATTQITSLASGISWKYTGANSSDQASKNYQGTKSGTKSTMIIQDEKRPGASSTQATYFPRSGNYNACIYTIYGYTYSSDKKYRLYTWASMYKGANKHSDKKYYWNSTRSEWYGSLDILMQQHQCQRSGCGEIVAE